MGRAKLNRFSISRSDRYKASRLTSPVALYYRRKTGNICYSEDKEILKRSRTLREYSMFIYFVNEYLDREMSLEEAVAEAVKRAKSEGILVDFLNKYATEVEGMLTGITVEKYGEVMKKEGFEDGKAAGLAEGEASGRAAEKIEMARTMKADNEPLEKIAKYTGLSIEDIDRL